MKYRKKPIVIDAVQYKGNNLEEILNIFEDFECNLETSTHLGIDTLEGKMLCGIGDYIIKGIKGEFYPCKEDIFLQTYEPLEIK